MYLLNKLAILLIATVFILSCASNSDEAELKTSIPVRIAEVKRIDTSIPVTSAGILSAKGEYKLSFKTGGLIDKILVDKGSKVKKGNLLAKLDLSEIQAQRNQALSGFEKAKRDYDRIKNLYQDSVVTREQLQNVETALAMPQYGHPGFLGPLITILSLP